MIWLRGGRHHRFGGAPGRSPARARPPRQARLPDRLTTPTAWPILPALPALPALSALTALSAPQGDPPPDSSDRHTILPIPIVFYQPETGTGFGLGVSLAIDAPASGPKAGRPDGYTLGAVYTTRNQIVTWLDGELFPAGRLWVTGRLGGSRFPTKTWGVGNNAPDGAEEDFTPQTVSLVGDAQLRVRSGLWAGVALDLAHRRFVAREDSGLLATGALPGAIDGRVMGVGVVVTWDTRDNSAFPRTGGVYQVRALGYGSAVGSAFGFTRISLDARRYLPVPGRHVIALRIVGMGTAGAPPFDHLPRLGGELLLRGYYEGRFRDRQLLALQTEWRAPVWWRFSVVAFGSAGQVGARLDDFAVDRFRAAVGGGVRFRFTDDGMNIRLDVARGITIGSGGFYLGVREAF